MLLKAALLFVLLVTFSLADLPVHCEYWQVKGTWQFTASAQSFDKDVVSYCNARNVQFQSQKTFQVFLGQPNIVYTDSSKSQPIGTWTMIFDQGLEVTIQGKKYFAFFDYKPHQPEGEFISYCFRTVTGTYHDADYPASQNKNYGCWSGQQITTESGEKVSQQPTINRAPVRNVQTSNGVFHNDMAFINKINAAQNSWRAGPYKAWEGKPLHHVQRMMGKSMPAFRREAHEAHMKMHRRLRAAENNELRLKDYPANFSWRNASGINYVPPARHQMNCGSCYIFSALGMFEARERIATKNAIRNIYSTQFVLNCANWGQGCDGGMPELISKYAVNYGLAKETCQPYIGENSFCYPDTCMNHHADFKLSFARDYGYVGGYYGASDHYSMMDEIMKSGPVAIAFMVYPDLVHYQGGVYRHVQMGENEADPKFEAANHAVLITGWGTTSKGEKYWEVRNSWGDEWGMEGYFWIARGNDECAVESDATFVRV